MLVARNAAGWLRECLQSLAQQTHPKLGVIGVDNASTDGTRELLVQALGEQRVLGLDENRGFAAAIRAAAELPPAQAADYLLVMHDDTALNPDAVARLVEAAEGIRGVERVGVVGPKVVDWADPRLLREVGRSTDRFGHPYSPLQEGELDQGQYDRVLEVLFVSSCAMLISREAWQRTGAFDERFAGHHDDLDFCWRARLAGFRVLMTPLAVARHRGASVQGERREEHRHRSSRYYAERAALASMLKDYGVPTLLWLLPAYAAVGLAKLVGYALSRRFEDAFDLVAAWGWNLIHLVGTVRRRVRAQSVRSVRDRAVRRFMAGTFRLTRLFEQAEEFLDEGFEDLDEVEKPEVRSMRARAAAAAAGHPVLVGTAIAIVLGTVAVRNLIGPEPLTGGAIAAFPASADLFFRELVSGVRTTVLGGAQPASPALAVLGGTSWLALGNPALAQKVLLIGLPALAGILGYRAFVRQTARPGTSVLAAGAYLLCAAVLWSFSEGRLGLLVGTAALPVVWDRFDAAFGRGVPDRPLRFGVGLGVAGALAVSFEPGFALAIGLVAGVHLLGGRHRFRGLGIALLGTASAALLAFPIALELVLDPSATVLSLVGRSDPWAALRLSPGEAPGGWAIAAFLPIAAIISFAGVTAEQRGRAWRAMAVAVAGTGLAWASAAGYLPAWMTNAPAYLITAGFAEAAMVAYGGPGLVSGLSRQAFGARQLGAALFAVVMGVGVGAQALQVTLAEWEIGPNGLPPAWPVVDASAGEFRILWVGSARVDAFPAPGGDPIGVVEAEEASARYTVTDRRGISALDVGRPVMGDGYDYLRRVLEATLAGGSAHAGALLGPLGIRFVVAGAGDLPAEVEARLDAQVDLDRIRAGGLAIYRNAAVLPTAWFGPQDASVPEAGDLAAIAIRSEPDVDRLPPPGSARRVPVTPPGEAVAADQFDPGWRILVDGRRVAPRRAFGWAIAGPVDGARVGFVYTEQWARTIEMAVLGILWLAALWITRRPGSA